MTTVTSARGIRTAPARPGGVAEFDDDDVDDTLIDLVLELSISDRLRSLCRYANALSRFRPI